MDERSAEAAKAAILDFLGVYLRDTLFANAFRAVAARGGAMRTPAERKLQWGTVAATYFEFLDALVESARGKGWGLEYRKVCDSVKRALRQPDELVFRAALAVFLPAHLHAATLEREHREQQLVFQDLYVRLLCEVREGLEADRRRRYAELVAARGSRPAEFAEFLGGCLAAVWRQVRDTEVVEIYGESDTRKELVGAAARAEEAARVLRKKNRALAKEVKRLGAVVARQRALLGRAQQRLLLLRDAGGGGAPAAAPGGGAADFGDGEDEDEDEDEDGDGSGDSDGDGDGSGDGSGSGSGGSLFGDGDSALSPFFDSASDG